MTTSTNETWDIVIRPKRAWWDLRLGELWKYRDLIRLLVWRDFVARYKQTVLGPFWYLITPVFGSIIYTIIFGQIAKLPTDGLPPFLFYMAGNTIWSYFSAGFSGTSNTFTSNAGIFGKVYFPRLVMPVSTVFSNLIAFAIKFLTFLGFVLYFKLSGAEVSITWAALLLPVLLLLLAGTGLGMGIIVSSLSSKYRDFNLIVSVVMQFMMYLSPVIYPLSTTEGIWRLLLLANPVTPVVEVFRMAFLGQSSLDPIYLLYSAAFMAVMLLVGIVAFNRVELNFMDTV